MHHKQPSVAKKDIMQLANDANEHARKHIVKGGTQLENNSLHTENQALHNLYFTHLGVGVQGNGYDVVPMPENIYDIKPRKFYVCLNAGELEYTVINPRGFQTFGTLTRNDLSKVLNENDLSILQTFDLKKIAFLLPKILSITAKRFNTVKNYQMGIREAAEREATFDLLEKNSMIAEYECVIEVTSKYSLGNCQELAMQAFDYILRHTDSTLNAEIFYISGGDHVILVLNRNPASDPADPLSWGEHAVICDPWANKVYKASDYKTHLENFYSNGKYNHTQPFDHERHTLRPDKFLNTAYVRKERSVSNLHEAFFTELDALKEKLNSYQADLDIEKNRLITKYGHNDKKALILARKYTVLTQAIDEIDQVMTSVLKKASEFDARKDQSHYRQIKTKLMILLQEQVTKSTACMQFSKDDLAALFANRNITPFWANNEKSTTQQHLEQITAKVNAALTSRF